MKEWLVCEMTVSALVKTQKGEREKKAERTGGPGKAFDKVQRGAEIKGSHADVWVGEKALPQGRGNRGDEGPEVGVHVKPLVKSKGACEAAAMVKVRQAVESLSDRALGPWKRC